jgi:D-amino-acid dehydrogenase
MVPYEGARLTALEPALRPELAGAWHCPTDAHLRPDRLMAALIPVLRARGVEILEGTTVEGIDVAAGQARGVMTSRGKMQCDLIVLATGAESPKLARLLGFHLPVQPGKGYSITLPRPKRAPQIPLILEESHVAVTPWLSGLRIGSTMEFIGYDRSINPRRIELFKRAAAEHLVDPADGPILEEWYGWRPMTYDELPCIGRAPKVPNVIVAAGHGMIGITSMTATGKLAAELALDVAPHLDPEPYSPRRFAR